MFILHFIVLQIFLKYLDFKININQKIGALCIFINYFYKLFSFNLIMLLPSIICFFEQWIHYRYLQRVQKLSALMQSISSSPDMSAFKSWFKIRESIYHNALESFGKKHIPTKASFKKTSMYCFPFIMVMLQAKVVRKWLNLFFLIEKLV